MQEVQEKVKQAFDAGYTYDEIYDYLSNSGEYGQKIDEARKEGYTDSEIREKLFRRKEQLPGAEIQQQTEFEALERLEEPKSFLQTFMDVDSISEQEPLTQALPAQQYKEFGKGVLSGGTIGLSENIQALKPRTEEYPEATSVGEASGSVAPVSGLLKVYGKAGQSALKTVPNAARYLTGLTNIVESGLAGSTYKVLEDSFQGKMPSVSDVAKHGAEWAVLDAGLQALGLTGQFASGLLSRSKAASKPSWKVINETMQTLKKEGIDISKPEEVAFRAFQEIESAAQEGKQGLKGRVVKEAEELSFRQETPFVSESIKEEVIDYAPRYRDKKEFGEFVQESIKEANEEAKKSWEPLYESVEPISENIKFTPKSTAWLAVEELNQLAGQKTTPTGYGPAKTRLVEILQDFGYQVKQNKKGQITGITPPKAGNLSVSDGIKLSRRISELGDYEGLEPSVSKLFNRISKNLKEESKSALVAENKQAGKVFERAERNYEAFQKKLQRENIRSIRYLEDTEKVSEIIKKPTALQDLKEITSPEDFKKIERELLEHVSEMPADKARKFLRETENYMSKEGKKLANDLVAEAEINEMMGKLYKNETLALEDASKLAKNASSRKAIEDIGGKKALDFFEKIEWYNKQLKANLNKSIKEAAARSRIERVGKQYAPGKEGIAPKPRKSELGEQKLVDASKKRHPYKAYLEDLTKDLGATEKQILGVVFGLGLGLKKVTATLIGAKIVKKLARSPQARAAYMKVVNYSRKDPEKFIQAFKQFSKLVQEED